MYVYLLKSITDPTKRYIGLTSNIKKRLQDHNNGKSAYTSRFMLWKLHTVIWFNNKAKAIKFEKYLKHGSGASFAKRHFW